MAKHGLYIYKHAACQPKHAPAVAKHAGGRAKKTGQPPVDPYGMENAVGAYRIRPSRKTTTEYRIRKNTVVVVWAIGQKRAERYMPYVFYVE